MEKLTQEQAKKIFSDFKDEVNKRSQQAQKRFPLLTEEESKLSLIAYIVAENIKLIQSGQPTKKEKDLYKLSPRILKYDGVKYPIGAITFSKYLSYSTAPEVVDISSGNSFQMNAVAIFLGYMGLRGYLMNPKVTISDYLKISNNIELTNAKIRGNKEDTKQHMHQEREGNYRKKRLSLLTVTIAVPLLFFILYFFVVLKKSQPDLESVNITATKKVVCAWESIRLKANIVGGERDNITYKWSAYPISFSSRDSVISIKPALTSSYFVTVMSGNQSVTDSILIKVKPNPKVEFTVDMKDQGANKISFIDQSVAYQGAKIVSWSWDFDDETSSELQNPIHTYPNAGTYDTELTIKDSKGCYGSVTKHNFVTIMEDGSKSIKLNHPSIIPSK